MLSNFLSFWLLIAVTLLHRGFAEAQASTCARPRTTITISSTELITVKPYNHPSTCKACPSCTAATETVTQTAQASNGTILALNNASVEIPLANVAPDTQYSASGDIQVSFPPSQKIKRQSSGSTCELLIENNGKIIKTIPLTKSGQLRYDTDSFSPPQGSTLKYIESCPPGVPRPTIRIGNVLVTPLPPDVSGGAGVGSINRTTETVTTTVYRGQNETFTAATTTTVYMNQNQTVFPPVQTVTATDTVTANGMNITAKETVTANGMNITAKETVTVNGMNITGSPLHYCIVTGKLKSPDIVPLY